MRSLLFLLCLLILAPVRPANAETVMGTAITKLPYIIKKSGVYRLTKSLSYAAAGGAAIAVEAPQVVIDLNGYELVAVTGSTTTATGIETLGSQERVTVRNGTVAGFMVGVLLQGSGMQIYDIVAARNYSTALSVLGDYAQITKNHVVQTGGASPGKNTVGINVSGNFEKITDNDVQDMDGLDAASVFTAAIRLVDASTFSVISNNRVLGVKPLVPSKSVATGILAQSSTDLTVLGNTVDSAETGFDFTGSTAGSYNNNVTVSAGTPYVPGGLTDLGGNH